jgi:hypothetical protein
MSKIFYVCSYGGSGSKMLCKYLNQFGITQHIHSRKPPEYLTHGEVTEWFGKNKMSDSEIKRTKVIYVYKDPVKSTLSRFKNKQHCRNVQSECESFDKVVATKSDLFKLEEFFDNYVNENLNLNYDIYAVKYEDLWSDWSTFNKIMDIPDIPSKYPIKKETTRALDTEVVKSLEKAYYQLKKKMGDMPFIKKITPS